MRVVRIPVGAVRRCIGSCLDGQEILIDIGLMGQVQSLLTDAEHLVLRAVNSS